jgi:hypothetical protein
MILGLSHGVQLEHVTHLSVNEATNPAVAPKESKAELGNILPQLLYAVATTAPEAEGPILFSKRDISQGWLLLVHAVVLITPPLM